MNALVLPLLQSRQLVMFSGKGGVGKTTLACAIARAWAQQSPKTVLLLSTDPAHSLADVLQMPVSNQPAAVADLPNLQVRALDAQQLLQAFKQRYGAVLELLVERGSFVDGSDLSPVWDMGWPGLDELMGVLEIQQILRTQAAHRVVVDMAPSGHTLNLFYLMDFLDTFLAALDTFQEKHRFISKTLAGRYTPDEADKFLQDMKADLASGRSLLQDAVRTACWIVAIPEAMSLRESERFAAALDDLNIPIGAICVNQLLAATAADRNRVLAQQQILAQFQQLRPEQPVLTVAQQPQEPIGSAAIDQLLAQLNQPPTQAIAELGNVPIVWPEPLPPGLSDFVAAGRRLVIVGGKGGVGKTTVAAAIAWEMAQQHPEAAVRVVSIDPAHSLGDALGQPLGHQPTRLTPNLSAQEIDAHEVLDQFRADYLWELAEMMGGEDDIGGGFQVIYGPEAWRQIVSEALPGIDEMLSLITIMELLEQDQQQLIVLDTAPTGHLLRFLEMPTALADWLAWIFKLWIKYQDVVGRTEFMGRLRQLRQRVVSAQKQLKAASHTEFIGVVNHQSAVLAEAQRLNQALTTMGIQQRYLIHNRYQPGRSLPASLFAAQTVVRLPLLPSNVDALAQVQGAAHLLFEQG
ncbi:ArsA family ATPase [Almyronema epifaneia]|uniref:ArsA family ATPase n=1 Tax=Almyronema epifaneia S1 TaxID=2991925 RepID=A0ABW6IKF3_9CYAN